MKSALGLMAALMFVILALAAQKNQNYKGEIMDSACANTGSHDAMMKLHSNMKTAKDCTLWVRESWQPIRALRCLDQDRLSTR
jgi:hypothetical protein